MGINLSLYEIQAGEIYRTTYKGPYGHIQAAAAEVILNVNFYEGGIGVIDDGSFYPNTLIDEEFCTSEDVSIPITDSFIYTADTDAEDHFIPSANILGYIPNENTTAGITENGIPIGYSSPLPFQGQDAGSISLAESEYFDSFPSEPVNPTICDEDLNCFDVILPNGTTVLGGDPLPGMTGGYVLKGNQSIPTIAPLENGPTQGESGYSDLYIEWHAIDGDASQTGLGDIIGQDEDGDGTDFDDIWTMESLAVTNLNPNCGYDYDVAGDLTQYTDMLGITDECLDPNPAPFPTVDVYVMHPDLSNWGNFLTYNAVMYQTTGGDAYLADDSDHDYNPVDEAAGGRLVMHFDNMCIPNINVRHVMLEFLDLDVCPDLGNINGDTDGTGQAIWNVLDIVMLANCVLALNCSDLPYSCAGDMNGDGGYNVLDIVTLANCVLAGTCGGRIDDAIESRLIMVDNVVSIEADGFIGGVQMTLTHGADFSIEMTDRALYSNYVTEGNETRLLVITPETEDLFSYNGDFEIAEIIVANSYAEVSVDLPLASSFSLSDAYPNPFNPTTTMKLTMPVAGDMQVAVYNLLGQVVVTLASGYMEASTYTLTWDAADVASGMYFVKAQAEGFTTTQKLMLVK